MWQSGAILAGEYHEVILLKVFQVKLAEAFPLMSTDLGRLMIEERPIWRTVISLA